jgi:hypothetical protein
MRNIGKKQHSLSPLSLVRGVMAYIFHPYRGLVRCFIAFYQYCASNDAFELIICIN